MTDPNSGEATPQTPPRQAYPQGQYVPPSTGYPSQYPAPGYHQQPASKKRNVWPWVLLGVVVLAFGGCAGLIGLGALVSDHDRKRSSPSAADATVTPGTQRENPTPSPGNGLTFPGKEADDSAANAGDTVTIDGLSITTTALFESAASDGSDRTLCTTVTVVNNGRKSTWVNGYSFKLQNPRGSIDGSMTFGRKAFASGEIASGGGTATGDACFTSFKDWAPGTYVVLYDPGRSSLSEQHGLDGRIGWINSR